MFAAGQAPPHVCMHKAAAGLWRHRQGHCLTKNAGDRRRQRLQQLDKDIKPLAVQRVCNLHRATEGRRSRGWGWGLGQSPAALPCPAPNFQAYSCCCVAAPPHLGGLGGLALLGLDAHGGRGDGHDGAPAVSELGGRLRQRSGVALTSSAHTAVCLAHRQQPIELAAHQACH